MKFRAAQAFSTLTVPQLAGQGVANMGCKPGGDRSGSLSLALLQTTEREGLSGGGLQGISDHSH